MAGTESKLPKRLYYTLEQAAEKLTRETNEPVTADDILHWAATSQIELVLKIEENWHVYFTKDEVTRDHNGDVVDYHEIDVNDNDNLFSLSSFIDFLSFGRSHCENIEQTGSELYAGGTFDKGTVFYLDFPEFTVKRLSEVDPLKDRRGSYLSRFDSVYLWFGYRDEWEFDVKEETITANKLYVLHQEVERLLAGNAMTEAQVKTVQKDEKQNKGPSLRKENLQNKVIAGLYKIAYSDDIHATRLSALDEAIKDLAAKGVSISNDTLRGYIKRGSEHIDKKPSANG